MAAPISASANQSIPSAWQERILKRDFEVVLGKMLQSEQAEADESEQFYLRSANVQWGRSDVSDVKTMWFSPHERRDLRLEAGDLLVNEGGDVGRCAIWNDELPECYFQNSINRIRPRWKSSPQFLYYWLFNLKNAGFIDAIVSRITIAHLTAEKLERIPWADVPISEQERIVAFLDASCAAIEAALAAKRQQLKILDAIAAETIQHAVTQGLNSRATMKPSGLDWLPAIPSKWQTRQIKRRCKLLRGKFSHRPRNDPAFYDGEYPFVQTGDITGAQKYIRTYSQTLNELGFSVSKMFPKGTLVMSIAANVGDVAILDFEACFPDSMVGLVPNHKTNLNFLYYLMRAMKEILLRSAVLTTQLNLNYVRIGTNFAPFPPKKEQEEIAAFLDAKLEEIRRTKAVLNQQVGTLVAYRQSLIHECVTGQRRVTEADLKRVGANV